MQAVLLWPEGRDERLEERILRSVRDERLSAGRVRRWRAFGMDMNVSEGLLLAECRVEPANADMTFAPEHGAAPRERFRRLGLVSHWLTGPVDGWLRLQVPKEVRVEREEMLQVDGHTVSRVRGRRRGWGGVRMLGRRAPYEACAWICPRDERLYSVAREGRPGDTAAERLAGRKLRCCEALQ